jgi:hypothetical protein
MRVYEKDGTATTEGLGTRQSIALTKRVTPWGVWLSCNAVELHGLYGQGVPVGFLTSI